VDRRAPDQITHSLADIIRFRLLMIAAGYEDGNDANSLRSDPMFKMALDLPPSDRELCSQSTISRLENLPDARALLRMGRAMVDLYCASFRKVPKRITLDIDDSFDAVHVLPQFGLIHLREKIELLPDGLPHVGLGRLAQPPIQKELLPLQLGQQVARNLLHRDLLSLR